MAKIAASFQCFYRTIVVRLDYLLIVYSYFMTTRETVKLLSRVSGEDLRKLRKSFPDLLLYLGIVADCSPKPWNNCFITQLFKNNTTLSTVRRRLSLMSGIQDIYQFDIIVFIESSRFAYSPLLMTSCRHYSVKVNFTSKLPLK